MSMPDGWAGNPDEGSTNIDALAVGPAAEINVEKIADAFGAAKLACGVAATPACAGVAAKV